MKLTSALFEAFIKCPTKCYLRSTGQTGSGNAYADWVREQNDAYRKEAAQGLVAAAGDGVATTTPGAEHLKTASWRLAVDLPLETEATASRLHAVERVPSQGRGKAAQFVPIRFVFRNKLTKDDRLLLAIDALVLSEVLGREASVGKIVHGDDHAALKVKVASLLGPVRKLTGKMSALLAGGSPPDLVLNRHCAECEFQDRCRKIAVEKDDLSLLGGMSAKERQRLRSKGIFTVTQLSYTFRPRRRPKRQREKREKYHHSLKALAIREKKIHIVGRPELKFEGTPVYLDVEGLPDRGFYYLIGVRYKTAVDTVHRDFWADNLEAEQRMWSEFLEVLADIDKPILIHYGSFETTFFKAMVERYGGPTPDAPVAQALNSALNVLSVLYAQVYFPTYSNRLKEIAGYLGFHWSNPNPSGLTAVTWRREWEETGVLGLKEQLLKYNADDCKALEIAATALMQLGNPPDTIHDHAVVHTELMPHQTMWPRFSSPLPEFEQVNKAARWDYQRDRIYVRSRKLRRKSVTKTQGMRRRTHKVNTRVLLSDERDCPNCGAKGCRYLHLITKVLHDLFFGKNSEVDPIL